MSQQLADLWLPASAVWLAAMLLAARDLPWLAALALASVRVAIPVCYFGWYYDPALSTTFLDDLVYVANARTLLTAGYGPWSVIVDPAGWDQLHALSHGHHVLYAWWNMLAMTLFGDHYFAAIFCNVLATFASGSLLASTLRQLRFPSTYIAGLLVFWLLHWDVVTWSSVLNAKDPIVQLLTITALWCLVKFVHGYRWRYAVGFAVCTQLFWWLRFYVPLLMAVALVLWLLTQRRDWRGIVLVPPCLLACLAGSRLVVDARQQLELSSIAFGAVRFLLTPVPWNVQEGYAFMTLAAALHWLTFIPAVAGAIILWRDSKPARLMFIYAVLLTALYAINDELLGPRQRFQVAFLLAWAQFHAGWLLWQAFVHAARWSPTSMPMVRSQVA